MSDVKQPDLTSIGKADTLTIIGKIKTGIAVMLPSRSL